MKSIENFVFTLPDGSVHYEDCQNDNWVLDKIAEKLVRSTGKTTKHGEEPQQVKVVVHRLYLDKGQTKRTGRREIKVFLPVDRMTESQFNGEMHETLKNLPQPFRDFVSTEAWDRGHSSGYEEVIAISTGMADKLEKCFKLLKRT